MSDREQLMDYLLDALNKSERDLVQARLRQDPAFRRELASARLQVAQIQAARRPFAPPPGLAQRTCDFVFAQARRLQAEVAKRWAMTPYSSIPGWAGRVRWIDMAVTATILVMAALIVLPAVRVGRLQARLASCEADLREVSLALAGYQQGRNAQPTEVSSEGRLANASFYGPVLVRNGFLASPRRLNNSELLLVNNRRLRVPTVEDLQLACERQAARLRVRYHAGGSYPCNFGPPDRIVLVPAKNLPQPVAVLPANNSPADLAPEHQQLDRHEPDQSVAFDQGGVNLVPATPASPAEDIFANDYHLVSSEIPIDDAVIGGSASPQIFEVNFR